MPTQTAKILFLTIIAFALIVLVAIYHAKYDAEAVSKKSGDSSVLAANPISAAPHTNDAMESPVKSPVTIVPKPAAPVKPLVPSITAESYLIGDLETGEVYISKLPDKVVPIASISKLMSALAAEDMNEQGILPADGDIVITEKMLEPYGTEGSLSVGEAYSAKELLYPLLLESSNDAAEALAEASGYDRFISAMKLRALEIGMTRTSFEDPSGLSNQNISNATDLFTFARYLHKTEPKILELSRMPAADLASTTMRAAHHYANKNPFVGDPHYIGGKTGRTDAARESMLSLFNYTVGEKTFSIAVIVLRSDYNSRQIDSSLLFEKFFMKVEGAH